MNEKQAYGPEEIAACDQPKCEQCGSAGSILFTGLEDRLFGAPGRWNLKQCSNQKCALVWLDPMPVASDLWKAYKNYYTHAAQVKPGTSALYRIWIAMKSGYLSNRFGYPLPSNGLLHRALGLLLYLFPVRRSSVNGEVRFLPAVKNGRLLDAGCGSGEFLVTMNRLGWQVEGFDFDEVAVNVARSYGFNVRQGALEDIRPASDHYDAVTLNHVIEHVPNPLAYLKECRRILKPGGKLVVVTPNHQSFGQAVFGENWRGWEPPRHLQVFAPKTMRMMLREAGFDKVSVGTHNAHYVWHHSYRLRRLAAEPASKDRTTLAHRLVPRILTAIEQMALVGFGDSGECIQAIAEK